MDLKKAIGAVLLLVPPAAAAVATARLYREPAEIAVDFEHGYEGSFLDGFYPRERTGELSFRWTAGDAYVRLAQLPVGGRFEVDVKVRALPFPGESQPTLRFSANGATALQVPATRGLSSYRFTIPASSRTLALGIHSPTFTTRDGRAVGVQIHAVRLIEVAPGRPSTRVRALLAAAAGLLFAGALSAGLALPVAAAGATAVSLGFVYLLAQRSVRFTDYPNEVLWLALGTLGVAWLLRAVVFRWRFVPAEDKPSLVASVGLAFLLKTALFTYPLFLSSDATFQANRLVDVLAGNFFPTSVTQHQPPFIIPYPIALYVLSAPWAWLGGDLVRVLEWMTALTEVGAALALGYLASRFLGSARAGAFAALVYAVFPINVFAFSSGNFTNVFGVGATALFVLSLLLLSEESAGRPLGMFMAATFVLSLIALTAHLSVFLSAVVLWPAWLVSLRWVERARDARSLSTANVTVGASVAAALAYYGGYTDLITRQLPRLLEREYSTGAASVSGPLEKIAFNLPFYREWIGPVLALVAAFGAVSLLRRPRKSAFHAVAASWAAVTAFFFLLDLFSSIEIRYLLQATPLLALFCGEGLARAMDRGRLGFVLAMVALASILWTGLWTYNDCLLYRYH